MTKCASVSGWISSVAVMTFVVYLLADCSIKVSTNVVRDRPLSVLGRWFDRWWFAVDDCLDMTRYWDVPVTDKRMIGQRDVVLFDFLIL